MLNFLGEMWRCDLCCVITALLEVPVVILSYMYMYMYIHPTSFLFFPSLIHVPTSFSPI